MAYHAGELIRTVIFLRDTAGDPITGQEANISVTDRIAPDGGSFSGLVGNPSELDDEDGNPSGNYVFSFVPTGAGTYHLRAEYTGSTTPSPQYFEDEWDVDSSTAGAAVSTPITAGGATLLRLYRDVADELGDLLTLTLTESGDSSTLVDAVNLVGPDNAYKGRRAYVVSGTAGNLGLSRLVQSSSQSASNLTVRPVLPADVTAGDVVDLVDDRGQGWTRTTIVAAINRAVRDAYPTHLVPLVSTLDSPISSSTTWIDGSAAIPDTFTHVSGVEYEDFDGNWREVVPQDQRYGEGYRVDANNAVVVLSPQNNWLLDGRDLRLRGYGEPAQLEDDDDTTSVNAEWVVAQVCAKMLWQAAHFDRMPGADQRAVQFQRRADALRGRIRTVPAANTQKIR